jgi:hypothetical protein
MSDLMNQYGKYLRSRQSGVTGAVDPPVSQRTQSAYRSPQETGSFSKESIMSQYDPLTEKPSSRAATSVASTPIQQQTGRPSFEPQVPAGRPSFGPQGPVPSGPSSVDKAIPYAGLTIQGLKTASNISEANKITGSNLSHGETLSAIEAARQAAISGTESGRAAAPILEDMAQNAAYNKSIQGGAGMSFESGSVSNLGENVGAAGQVGGGILSLYNAYKAVKDGTTPYGYVQTGTGLYNTGKAAYGAYTAAAAAAEVAAPAVASGAGMAAESGASGLLAAVVGEAAAAELGPVGAAFAAWDLAVNLIGSFGGSDIAGTGVHTSPGSATTAGAVEGFQGVKQGMQDQWSAAFGGGGGFAGYTEGPSWAVQNYGPLGENSPAYKQMVAEYERINREQGVGGG